MLQQVFDGRLWSDVGVTVVLAGAIGFERQLRGKPAGIRTSILVCLGTVMFMRLGRSIGGPGTDPTRVLGQVVTGIGFLGGGVILRHDGLVHGVTSAAIIWLLAAIGCAIGLDEFGIAVVMTVIGLSVSVGVEWLQKLVPALARDENRGDDRRESSKRNAHGGDDA